MLLSVVRFWSHLNTCSSDTLTDEATEGKHVYTVYLHDRNRSKGNMTSFNTRWNKFVWVNMLFFLCYKGTINILHSVKGMCVF